MRWEFFIGLLRLGVDDREVNVARNVNSRMNNTRHCTEPLSIPSLEIEGLLLGTKVLEEN